MNFNKDNTISISVYAFGDKVEMWTIMDNDTGLFKPDVHMTLRSSGSDPDGDLWSNTEIISSIVEYAREWLSFWDLMQGSSLTLEDRLILLKKPTKIDLSAQGKVALEGLKDWITVNIHPKEVEQFLTSLISAWDDIQKLVKLP